LALLVVCLAAVIYWEVNLGSNASALVEAAERRSGVDQPTSTEQNAFAMPPFRSFAEVTERPLFSPTRRPLPDAAASAVSEASPSRLVGIVIGQSARVALVEVGQPPSIERVTEGGRIGSWTIERILPDRIIVLTAGSRTEIKPELSPGEASKPPAIRRPGAGPLPASPVSGRSSRS
jgi:hypothetical protein